MIPGLGLTRRFLTLALLAFAFWGGMHVARLGAEGRCLEAGGKPRADGLCGGLP